VTEIQQIERQHTATDADAGSRVDQVAAAAWPDFSRSRLTAWIRDGRLRVGGRVVKPNHRLRVGDRLALDATLEMHATNPRAEAMTLSILFEDEQLLIVDKPAGMVVHPGSGNRDGTLVNGLLHHDPDLAALPRAGLIHRLDKDTSGCLVVARTPAAHTALVRALKRREIERHYLALVWGRLIAGGHVDAPLGRHPVDRRRQVVRPDGRRAVTHYRVARRLAGATLLDVRLETGRTHQIRVHMQHAGFPLVGDPMYGRRGCPAGLTEAQRAAWTGFPRQALHACSLRLAHPATGAPVAAQSPTPADLAALLEALKAPDAEHV
jgi:23S rRNA pseudouridine1911/1915/1917 synthase